jgi:arylsulfatase A-like enzyme
MDKSMRLRAWSGAVTAWATAIVYGVAAGVADFGGAAFRGIGLMAASVVGFRTAGLVFLLAGVTVLTVLCLIRMLERAKPGLVSPQFKTAIVLGSGTFPIALVVFFGQSPNGYQALVKSELVAGAVILAAAALLSKASRAVGPWERLVALIPRFCMAGTVVIFPLFVFATLMRWQAPPGPAQGAKKSGGPNIVLVIIDSARADHFSVYGYRYRTSPFLERLAAESTVFDNAIAASPWTLPSHASIFTGLYPGQHNTHAEHFWLDDGYRTMAEILADNGYQTVMFSNNDYVSQITNLVQGFERCWYKGRWTDDARYYGQGFGRAFDLLLASFWSEWNDRVLSKLVKNPADALDYPTAAVTNSAIRDWLEKDRDKKRPFFLCVNYMDVHFPYNPRDETARLFLDEAALGRSYGLKLRRPPVEYSLDASKGQYTAEELRIINGLYDADIHSLDAELERLCAKLRALGVYDQTAIFITSDHGEYLGTHNRLAHGLGLHEEVLRIPLLARYPGVFTRGKRVDSVVTHVDLFETVLALAKVEERPSGMPETEKLFSIPEGIDRRVFSEYRFPLHVLAGESLRDDNSRLLVEQRMVRDRTHKLIWKSRGNFEFFDLAADPFELKNLYAADNKTIELMERDLFKWMASDVPPAENRRERKGRSPNEDIRLIERMRTLGYVK